MPMDRSAKAREIIGQAPLYGAELRFDSGLVVVVDLRRDAEIVEIYAKRVIEFLPEILEILTRQARARRARDYIGTRIWRIWSPDPEEQRPGELVSASDEQITISVPVRDSGNRTQLLWDPEKVLIVVDGLPGTTTQATQVQADEARAEKPATRPSRLELLRDNLLGRGK